MRLVLGPISPFPFSLETRTLARDKCDKSYKGREYLLKHVRYIHNKSEVGKWVCNICQKEFAQYGPLSIHKRRIHLENKPQNCQECGKTFKSDMHLQSHMRATHNAQRDSECPVCHKKYTKYGLFKHMKYHEGNIFECIFCDFNYATRESLKFHVKKKHMKGDNYICPQCDFISASEIEAQNHKKNIHSK